MGCQFHKSSFSNLSHQKYMAYVCTMYLCTRILFPKINPFWKSRSTPTTVIATSQFFRHLAWYHRQEVAAWMHHFLSVTSCCLVPHFFCLVKQLLSRWSLGLENPHIELISLECRSGSDLYLPCREVLVGCPIVRWDSYRIFVEYYLLFGEQKRRNSIELPRTPL